jgi:hypothetical protein
VLILGVSLADHTAADIAVRLDTRDRGLAERIGLALDGDRVDLPISPDEARALLLVLEENPDELPLRTALELELGAQTDAGPSRGFGRWGHRRSEPPDDTLDVR